MVDLDIPLSQKFLEIPVRQSVPQVPPNGDEDRIRREPEAGECRSGLVNRAHEVTALHPGASSSLTLGTNPISVQRGPNAKCLRACGAV
jgi:hypothetical protein